MRHRLDALVGHDLAKDLWVGTFHATCARLIRRHYEALDLTRDFAIYDDADQRAVINRIVKEKKLDDKRYPPRQLLSAIHKHKQEGRTHDDVERNDYFADVVADVLAAYETAVDAWIAWGLDVVLLELRQR